MQPVVNRSPLAITQNSLPKFYMGQWLSEAQVMTLRVKPAYDDSTIMIEVSPVFLILDASTRVERFRFQTSTTFSFSGTHSKNYIDGLILHLVNLNIDEFNEALKNTGSMLIVHRKFERMSIEEIKPKIDEAFNINYWQKSGVKPHWKVQQSKSESQNNLVLESLPIIPGFKHFTEKFTSEQQAFFRCMQGKAVTEDDLKLIRVSISFMKDCLGRLKNIDLIVLTDLQANRLKEYLRYIYSISPCIFNDVSVQFLYRATLVHHAFLEKDKVREAKYLKYPPLEIVQARGVYNRANTSKNTLFYAAEHENVAVRELKPKQGSRIIISTWENSSGKPLISFPICLSAGINNKMADSASYAFEQIAEKMHPDIAEWMRIIFEFLASEFIKESEPTNPKRYDYLFSALFADMILQDFPEGTAFQNYDAIVYPSVAWHHIPNNVAIRPEVLDNRFKLVDVKEFEVMETCYDKEIRLYDSPALLNLKRKSQQIVNGIINWNDD